MSNKKVVKKVVKTSRKLNFDESVQHIAEAQKRVTAFVEEKTKELVEKHNNLVAAVQAVEEMMKKVMGFFAGSVGEVQAKSEHNAQIVHGSLVGLDTNVLALAEMVKEFCGQFRQADLFIQRLAEKTGVVVDLTPEEVTDVTAEAETWYRDLAASAFDKVREKREERERLMKEKQEAEQTAKEAAEKAAKDKEEQDRMEAGLEEAEAAERSILSSSGGGGATIPAGADIFGG